ncbi:MAG: NAD-dependent epimerase/dehydratase family protein [Rhizomicrobium sp.]
MVTQHPPSRHLLVVGGYGVIGTGIVGHGLALPNWRITTVGRSRAPERLLDGRPTPRHVQADLSRLEQASDAFTSLSDVTAMVFTAFVAEGHTTPVAPNVALLANALDALKHVGAPLSRVVLMGGGKSYGAHLGSYKTPAKERDPRIMGPIFYNDQEDTLWQRAARDGFGWTVLRPDGVIGPNFGSPMNMLMGLAAFAAVSKELRVPLRFPGSLGAWQALHQATDADVLAQAAFWALESEAALGEVFNVTNGDNFRWQHLWPDIAAAFDMPAAAPQPMRLMEQMADKGPLWASMVRKYDLRDTPWDRLASWPFVDGWLHIGNDMVQSTTKIRHAGFNGCIDSHDSFVAAIARLRAQKIVP